jgi:type II secretory pathway pseudopilin PulG
LLEVALVLLLVSAAIAAGFIHLRAQVPARQAQAEEAALTWADQALVAFAAAYGRLPCPAATANGIEDCGTGAKGWLPATTLETVKPRFDADGPGRMGPARYVVYRGTGNDLAVAADRYSPWQWDSDNSKPSDWGLAAVNGLDFCAALGNAQAAGYDGAQAHVDGPAGAPVNIAYGIAMAGPTAGDAGRFDDTNAGAAPTLDAPNREGDATYDDRVRVRDFASLSESMSCSVTLASADAVGRASDIWAEAEGQQENNQADAQVSVTNATVALLLQGADVTGAVGDITSSGVTLGTISAELSAAIAACALPPWVQCALIPVFTAALGTDVAAVTAAAGSIATNASALALTVTALGMSADAAVRAKADVGAALGGIDPAQVVPQATVDAACAGADDAARKRDDAKATLDTVTVKRDAAQQAYASRLASIATEDGHSEQRDNLGARLMDWADAKQAVAKAAADVAGTKAELDAWNANNGGSCTDSTYCTGELAGKNYESIASQCQNETDEAKRKLACDTRDKMVAEQATKQANYDNAVAALASARTAADQAKTAYGQAYAQIPNTPQTCNVSGRSVDCPDIDVNGSLDANLGFSPATYCSANGDKDQTYSCDTNRLKARELYTDAMGYPPEAAASGSDQNAFDPESQLGADGYASLVQQTGDAQSHYDDAVASATKAAEGCQSLRDLQQGITPSGSPTDVWKGAEDVIKAVDGQGVVGPPGTVTP